MKITGRWLDIQINGRWSGWFWSPRLAHKINFYSVCFRRFAAAGTVQNG